MSGTGPAGIPGAPAVDAERVVAELRELGELTGGHETGGARRVAWTAEWRRAREWLTGKLAAIGVEAETDEAGNLWATLAGEPAVPSEADRDERSDRDAAGVEPGLGLGSHIDSVPAGGWLDGALGVVAALGVLRAWAEAGIAPPRALTLIDFADEEGARFGRSLLGSSAVSGTLDVEAVAALRDADDTPIAEALAENGVDLHRMTEAEGRLASIGAYLELHIEQGPVLEGEGLPCAAVSGCAGVERLLLRFSGRASHAGTTPMDSRRDAGLAAASVALAVEQIARDAGGVGTTGSLALEPGIMTAVAGSAELSVDLRHDDAGTLASMLEAVGEVGARVAAVRDCELESRPVWSIAPIPFDPDLVAIAALCCEGQGGSARPMRSGALHDAAEIARRLPVAMIFTSSTGGVSHNEIEDTPVEHLLRGIRAFGELANVALMR